ncbi:hypothetical protein NDU88_005997, partial [Pleurodeles waltl]
EKGSICRQQVSGSRRKQATNKWGKIRDRFMGKGGNGVAGNEKVQEVTCRWG